MDTNIYNDKFHENRELITGKAAEKVLKIIHEIVNVNSIVDVGCGIGVWLNRASKIWKLEDYIGLDGGYIDKAMLLIPNERFIAINLENEIDQAIMKKKYDLAICLEVVEHLSLSRANLLVKELTELSDLVLFSGATVGQPGDGHINNQFISYWANEFKKNGYQAFDLIRPRIQNEMDIPHWYRNNILIYINKKSTLFDKMNMINTPPLLHTASEELYVRYYEANMLNELRLSVYEKWFDFICGGKSIKETLNNYNSIAIYGIGYFGKRLVKLLETEGIIIKFLIDQKVREYLDYDVFNPSVKIPHVDLIIITNCMDVEEIKNNINADSNTKIQSISELLKDNNY